MGYVPAPVAIMHPVGLSGWKPQTRAGSHSLHPGAHVGRGCKSKWPAARLVC